MRGHIQWEKNLKIIRSLDWAIRVLGLTNHTHEFVISLGLATHAHEIANRSLRSVMRAHGLLVRGYRLHNSQGTGYF